MSQERMTSNYTKDDNSNMLSELHAEQDLKAANRPDAAVATTGQELWLDEMPKKRVKNKQRIDHNQDELVTCRVRFQRIYVVEVEHFERIVGCAGEGMSLDLYLEATHHLTARTPEELIQFI